MCIIIISQYSIWPSQGHFIIKHVLLLFETRTLYIHRQCNLYLWHIDNYYQIMHYCFKIYNWDSKIITQQITYFHEQYMYIIHVYVTVRYLYVCDVNYCNLLQLYSRALIMKCNSLVWMLEMSHSHDLSGRSLHVVHVQKFNQNMVYRTWDPVVPVAHKASTADCSKSMCHGSSRPMCVLMSQLHYHEFTGMWQEWVRSK